MFQAGKAHQRPGLLLYNQYVYAGFASHCVLYNFTGWIMGFDKTTGNTVEAFTMEAGPESNTDVKGGGILHSRGFRGFKTNELTRSMDVWRWYFQ